MIAIQGPKACDLINDLGISESGLDVLIKESYDLFIKFSFDSNMPLVYSLLNIYISYVPSVYFKSRTNLPLFILTRKKIGKREHPFA